MNSLEKWVQKLSEGHTVYVAGGAPLDMHLGKKPKDIDIFVVADWDWNLGEITKQLAGQWCIVKSKPQREGYGSDQVVYWTTIGDTQIDIIGIPPDIKSVAELVSGFDFNICEAWITNIGHNEEWDVLLSNAAKQAIKSKSIEYRTGSHINRHFNTKETNKDARIARYKKKFPDYIIWGKL